MLVYLPSVVKLRYKICTILLSRIEKKRRM